MAENAQALIESLVPFLKNPQLIMQRLAVTSLASFTHKDDHHRQLVKQSGAIEAMQDLYQRTSNQELQAFISFVLKPFNPLQLQNSAGTFRQQNEAPIPQAVPEMNG